MTLTTHAIVGAAAASFFPGYPAIAFLAAAASHFVIDAIPHWEYSLLSDSIKPEVRAPLKLDKNLIRDLVYISTDALTGICLAVFIFFSPSMWWVALIGAAGGIAPDSLHFVYILLEKEPFVTIERFHIWIQTDKRFQGRPWPGITTQLVLVIVVVSLTKYFLSF